MSFSVAKKSNESGGESKAAGINEFEGPAWELTQIYPSTTSVEFDSDKNYLNEKIQELEKESKRLRPIMESVLLDAEKSPWRENLIKDLQNVDLVVESIRTLLANLMSYVNCELCIDDSRQEIKLIQNELYGMQADFESAGKIIWMFLDKVSENFIEDYLKSPKTEKSEFSILQSRILADTLLTEKEEKLITRFKLHGPALWGDLYNQIGSTIKCKMEVSGKEVEYGLSQAMSFLRDSDEKKRKQAWSGIQEGWHKNEYSCASILNGIAGWRIEELQFRSHKKKQHFLDQPLHLARIKKETLEAMFESLNANKKFAQGLVKTLAKGMGKEAIDPWDIIASAPVDLSMVPFAEGVNLVSSSLLPINKEMADFVKMCEEKKWLEGRLLASKRQGAFSLRLAKTGEPRVYQSYSGTLSDVRTLAHELGHAYQFWIMRDLPVVLHRYPMTLMETASIFNECALGDYKNFKQSDFVYAMHWQNLESATNYLLNMPARYEFEREFYERRIKGFVSAKELGDLTEKSWFHWYGDSIAKADRMFWASKLHFSLPWISFYNYPYTFGYLYSLSLYAIQKQMGESFHPIYVALLRDTGRMSAEDLTRKHFGLNISSPEFWNNAIGVIKEQARNFEIAHRQRLGSLSSVR